MCQAEPEPIHPAPGKKIPDDDKHEAGDDEHNDAEVREQDGIREKLVGQHLSMPARHLERAVPE